MQIAEIELRYSTKVPSCDRPKISSPEDAYPIFRESWNMDTIELIEECKLLLLNRASRVLGIFSVSTGGLDTTIIDSKLVFAVALKAAASGIILCHNHLSEVAKVNGRMGGIV